MQVKAITIADVPTSIGAGKEKTQYFKNPAITLVDVLTSIGEGKEKTQYFKNPAITLADVLTSIGAGKGLFHLHGNARGTLDFVSTFLITYLPRVVNFSGETYPKHCYHQRGCNLIIYKTVRVILNVFIKNTSHSNAGVLSPYHQYISN